MSRPAKSVPVRLPANDPWVARLAAWRREKSLELRVPAYRVVPNATLLALARERPRSVRALLEVPGIGPARAEQFGLELLALLKRKPRKRSGTTAQS